MYTGINKEINMLKKNTQLKVAKKLGRLEDRLINYSSSCEISQDSQSDNSLSSYLLTLQPSKKAFTLAEVLITLGIIGVVASMTIPVLIQKHNNQVVETRLKKIYTIMNQAILMSEAQNGPVELWNFSDPNFWDTHFAPYLNILKTESLRANGYDYKLIYFPDGSLLLASQNKVTEDEETGEVTIAYGGGTNHDFIFYPNAKNFNEDGFKNKEGFGIYSFMFLFENSKKGFSPYYYNLQSDLSNMLSGFRHSCNKDEPDRGYCTYYIYQNGWKIPKNYPFKVR